MPDDDILSSPRTDPDDFNKKTINDYGVVLDVFAPGKFDYNKVAKRAAFVVDENGTNFTLGWDLATSLKAAYAEGKLVVKFKNSLFKHSIEYFIFQCYQLN